MKETTRQIIFHHPLPLSTSGRSGSQVRPIQMLEAFKNQGFEVFQIVGHAQQRKEGMLQVQHLLKTGKARIDFIYCESTAAPVQLTEPNHLPLHPTLDANFFHWCRQNHIPVGLFYRDIYWRFEQSLPSVGKVKGLLLKFFHHIEWKQICRSVDHLFLPSLVMFDALPPGWTLKQTSALPPACTLSVLVADDYKKKNDGVLSLLYVGAIIPPLYDIGKVIAVMKQLPQVSLTICCREYEWQIYKNKYDIEDLANVNIVHQSGKALRELYAQSDASLAVFGDDPYRKFAMPVKIFESLGYGVPIIASDNTSASKFVVDEGIGWSIQTENQLASLLIAMIENPDMLRSIRDRIQKVRIRHTWEQRVQQVANTLGTLY